jgi:hypothetical protein
VRGRRTIWNRKNRAPHRAERPATRGIKFELHRERMVVIGARRRREPKGNRCATASFAEINGSILRTISGE